MLVLSACHNNPPKVDPEKDETEVGVDSLRDPLDLLSDSIAMDGNRVELYLRRAQLYVEREQIGQAMIDVNQAIQISRRKPPAQRPWRQPSGTWEAFRR